MCVPGGSGASVPVRVENELRPVGRRCNLSQTHVQCLVVYIYIATLLQYMSLCTYLVIAAHRCPRELKMNFDRLAGGIAAREAMFIAGIACICISPPSFIICRYILHPLKVPCSYQ